MLSFCFIMDKAIIISHCIRWRRAASFTLPPLYARMHIPRYQMENCMCHKKCEKLIINKGPKNYFYSIVYTVMREFYKTECFVEVIKLFNLK